MKEHFRISSKSYGYVFLMGDPESGGENFQLIRVEYRKTSELRSCVPDMITPVF